MCCRRREAALASQSFAVFSFVADLSLGSVPWPVRTPGQLLPLKIDCVHLASFICYWPLFVRVFVCVQFGAVTISLAFRMLTLADQQYTGKINVKLIVALHVK